MIDLKEQYGKRYRVTLDESWDVERDKKAVDRPWYDEIGGRRGWCYLQNRSVLAIELNNRIFTANKDKLSFPYVHVRGGGETQKLFVDEKHIDKAISLILPRKRKQLSEDQKRQLSERLTKFRFKAANG